MLDPLAAARRHRTARITAPGAAEIRAALALAREFDLRPLLIDPAELRPFLDRLDAWTGDSRRRRARRPVRPGQIADPPIPDPDDPEPRDPWEDAAALLDAGLSVAIAPGHRCRPRRPALPRRPVHRRRPLGREVLEMLTSAPAELLGVADRVGTLAPGKDADFAVLTGDPFDLTPGSSRSSSTAVGLVGRRRGREGHGHPGRPCTPATGRPSTTPRSSSRGARSAASAPTSRPARRRGPGLRGGGHRPRLPRPGHRPRPRRPALGRPPRLRRPRRSGP